VGVSQTSWTSSTMLRFISFAVVGVVELAQDILFQRHWLG
jgi:hypothetical protein